MKKNKKQAKKDNSWVHYGSFIIFVMAILFSVIAIIYEIVYLYNHRVVTYDLYAKGEYHEIIDGSIITDRRVLLFSGGNILNDDKNIREISVYYLDSDKSSHLIYSTSSESDFTFIDEPGKIRHIESKKLNYILDNLYVDIMDCLGNIETLRYEVVKK